MDLKAKIPTGSWSLYYHSPTDRRWTPGSYTKVCTVDTYEQFFAVMNGLEEVTLHYGMLFWMRGSITPLYENIENLKGGSYSIRVSRSWSAHYYKLYTLAAMLNAVFCNSDNIVNAVSITPKKVSDKAQSYNVIRVWNRDCSKFNKPAQLNMFDGINTVSEILYVPHIDRNL